MKSITFYREQANVVDLAVRVNIAVSKFNSQLRHEWFVNNTVFCITFVFKRLAYGAGTFHWHEVEEALSAEFGQQLTLSEVF